MPEIATEIDEFHLEPSGTGLVTRSFAHQTQLRAQDAMPAEQQTETVRLMLPRLGAAIAGVALICPALTVPLVLACLAGLGQLAWEEGRANDIAPEVPSAKEARSRLQRMARDVTAASEDSFPASDPPSWTPVTGTGTRH